jgi:hypothetical protein
VDHLQRAGAGQQVIRRRSKSFPYSQQQGRAKTLTPGKQAPANSRMHRSGLVCRGGDKAIQLRINQRTTLREKVSQIGFG